MNYITAEYKNGFVNRWRVSKTLKHAIGKAKQIKNYTWIELVNQPATKQ